MCQYLSTTAGSHFLGFQTSFSELLQHHQYATPKTHYIAEDDFSMIFGIWTFLHLNNWQGLNRNLDGNIHIQSCCRSFFDFERFLFPSALRGLFYSSPWIRDLHTCPEVSIHHYHPVQCGTNAILANNQHSVESSSLALKALRLRNSRENTIENTETNEFIQNYSVTACITMCQR